MIILQNGALAVPDGRAVVQPINELLQLPFVLKLATKDHHPPDHISFAHNHAGAEPYTSTTLVVNPSNPNEAYETGLWPAHCVIGTRGNELAKELDASHIDRIILKGQDPRVEMYSAFSSPLRSPPLPSAVSELSEVLKSAGITDLYVVGLAGDYCVLYSALDSSELGWRTYVVEDAVRCVEGSDGWTSAKRVMERKGVKLIHQDSPEVEWVKSFAK